MAFLDEKEDVIKIELTSYGKKLLSRGKLKPVYYSFHDEAIMYDAAYAGIIEHHNSSSARIQSSPQMTPQASFFGVSEKIRQRNWVQPSNERDFILPFKLGDSSLSSDKYPAWKLKALHGEITGSVAFSTGSHQQLRIPQLTTIIEYETSIGYTFPDKITESESEELTPMPLDDVQDRIYEDGSFIDVKEDYLLFEIEEKNAKFINENFEIEVFKVETKPNPNITGSFREELIPLKFVKRESSIQNELLIDLKEEPLAPDLDTTYVEYFLDIFIDSEIDKSVFCENKAIDKKKNIFADSKIVCDDEKTSKKDIYREPDDDIEDPC